MKKSINKDIYSTKDFKKSQQKFDRLEYIKELTKIVITAMIMIAAFYCLILMAYAVN